VRAIFHVGPSLLKTEKELREFTSHGIDDLSKSFRKHLGLRLEELGERDWKTVREASHRRNIIVHNKGKVDRKYREKTGYAGTNGYLAIDKPYISNLVDAIVNFIDFIHDRVSRQPRMTAEV